MSITREVMYVDRRIEWFAASGGNGTILTRRFRDCMKYEIDKNFYIIALCTPYQSIKPIISISRLARGIGLDSALEWRRANKLNRAHELCQNSCHFSEGFVIVHLPVKVGDQAYWDRKVTGYIEHSTLQK